METGFTFLALMVAVVLVNVALGVAMTSWITIDCRADEAEAVWRGQQYVRALECFQTETGGALPIQVEQLVESSCIRRLWGDPLTGGADFIILRTSDLLRMQQEALEQQAQESGGMLLQGGGLEQGFAATGGRDTSLTGTGRRAGSLLASREAGIGGIDDESSLDAIVGVMSRRTGDALRSYRGMLKYEEWLFVVGS